VVKNYSQSNINVSYNDISRSESAILNKKNSLKDHGNNENNNNHTSKSTYASNNFHLKENMNTNLNLET